jgi:hypothetical protein
MSGLGEKFSDKDVEDMIKVIDKSGKGSVITWKMHSSFLRSPFRISSPF